MPIKLDRVFEHPILEPLATNSWEAAAVFNCAAVYHDNR
ncbi:MAG: glycosidase, partial [Spirochaetes bacterium]